MTFLKISNINNSDQYFYLDKENSNKLEIVFNLSEKGKEWSQIGDVLYNYSINKNHSENLKISKEKFHFLRKLANNNGIKKYLRKP